MKRHSPDEMNDELQPEYDLRTLLQGGERGKYAERYKAGTKGSSQNNRSSFLPQPLKGRQHKA